MSLAALAIDAMLPALPMIAADLGATGVNQGQLVIAFLFLGLSAGQLLYGPLSDHVGRRRGVLVAFITFIIGSLMCEFAVDFHAILVGRVVQGFGAAGSRIITIAMIRDLYSGKRMAQVMSLVMSIFVLVPVIAPTIGQLILQVAHWRRIFTFCWVLALFIIAWFFWRQEETLSVERRIRFTRAAMASGFAYVLRNPVSRGYGIATGLIFGAFIGYLNAVQQIFQDIYGVGDDFPLYFAVLALSFGFATLMNSRVVQRFGMQRLVQVALVWVAALAIAMSIYINVAGQSPILVGWMVYLLATFMGVGVLFGNLNSLAMEPLGHIAGIGAAVIGSMSTLICVPIGIAIGQQLEDSVAPIVYGFGVLAILSFVVVRDAERRKLAAESI